MLVSCASSSTMAPLPPTGCDPCDEALSREARGTRDSRFDSVAEVLKKNYPAPSSEDRIDESLLLGAVGAVVARDTELESGKKLANKREQEVPLELFVSFRRELRDLFARSLQIAVPDADALAETMQREALAAAFVAEPVFEKSLGGKFLSRSELLNLLQFAAEKVFQNTTVDRNFDVPFAVGYAQDDVHFVFIDRHISEGGGAVKDRALPAYKFLALRARFEKVLLDGRGLNYRHAHQLAIRLERWMVRALGFEVKDYESWRERHLREVGQNRPLKIHPRLDMTPYFSYPTKFRLLIEMDQAKKRAQAEAESP